MPCFTNAARAAAQPDVGWRGAMGMWLLAASSACFLLAALLNGCVSAPRPAARVLVAAESSAAQVRDSALAAHVAAAAQDNAAAAAALPVAPEPGDIVAASELSAAVYSADAQRASMATQAAAQRAATLARELAQEREQRALELQRTINEFNAALTQAEAAAEREARARITTIFAGLGAAVVALGIASAVTGWSRVGVSLIPAGIALGGSGLLWGRAWFVYTVGGAVALCTLACGILWAVHVSRAKGQIL